MARRIALLILLSTYGTCMEMRETVERMVMVRTTGSDLQPAATGYIYKKESDGPASVIQMGESEVMEQLSKLYGKPKAFVAPVPAAAGPFHADDEKKAASHSEAYVIPVVEKTDEEDKNHDHVDGIADEDYGKIFEGYGSDFKGYKGDFSDYLHGLGHFVDGVYHEHGGGKDFGLKGHHAYGDKENKGYATAHHYGKGGDGDYHSEKHESFSVSKKGGHKKDYDEDDAFGKHYAHGQGYKGGDHGHKSAHSKGEKTDGFHKLYDKNEFKKDHDVYDEKAHKGGFNKFGHGHAYHGSDAGGFKKGDSHESGYYKGDFGKGGFHDKDSGEKHGAAHSAEEGGESSYHHDGDFGAKDGHHDGKGYGYKVKH